MSKHLRKTKKPAHLKRFRHAGQLHPEDANGNFYLDLPVRA
jgi:hypothetical protein